MERKATRKRYDINFAELAKMIESGISGQEIMRQLGIPTRARLEKAVYDLSLHEDKLYKLTWESRAKAKTAGAGRRVAVGKKGGIMISASRLAKIGCDFSPKDVLEFAWTDGKLVISKV